VIKTKVLENYLIHANPDTIPRYVVNDLLIDIGRIERMVRDFQKIKFERENLQDFMFEQVESDLLEQAEGVFEGLPDLQFFLNLELSCDDDFFFESLISVVKTTALSLQSDLFKRKNATINRITENLNTLKSDYLNNARAIFEIEQDLTRYNEWTLKSELNQFKSFDRLNSEKITPHFMSLAKSFNAVPDLDKIEKAGGRFNNNQAREDYITEFYSKLYAKPDVDKM
jgi:hypothetical protein